MRSRTLLVVLAVLIAVALTSGAHAATKVAKPATKAAKPAAPAKAKSFDQKAVLMEMWKAPDSTVVGTVNGAKVTKGELMKLMWQWNAPSTLQDILNQKIIEQAAAKAKVTVSPKELQTKMQESVKRMQMQTVQQLLDQFRVTYFRFESGTKVSALAEKTVQKSVKVTDAEYAEWIKARHILIRFPQEEKDKAKQEEIAKKKIDEIAAKIKAGEDFVKLADEYSEDPGNSATGQKQGGDLGWFSRGKMVQEFEKAAFEMKAGQLSEPIKTFYGFHIIKVEKIGKDATPAEKAELNKQILERKVPGEMQKWFTDLQATAKVDNKLMAAPVKPPAPAMAPAPRPKVTPAPKTAPTPAPAPNTENAPPPPSEPPAGDKPETPPPPPPPAN